VIDERALRSRIAARKALVDEGDYFALLGVPRSATGYDIRRAYVGLRREFEPSRILTAQTVDLRDDVDEIVEVLEEAFEVLSDEPRRERYRRALEAVPRSG
jgi:curved DNA-binding protein CbpA